MAGNLDLNVIISASFNKLKQGIGEAVSVVKGGTKQMEQAAAGSKKALESALGGENLRVKRRELTQTINEQRSILTSFKQDLINLENKLAQTSKGDLMRQKALKNAIAGLKIEIKDQEQAVRQLSETRTEANFSLEEGSRRAEQNTQATEALSRAINAGSTAVLLFSGNNETLSNAMQGVRTVMGLASAAVAVYNLAQRENEIFTKAATSIQAAYATVVGTSTGALKAFRIALAATGIGAAVVIIGSLVAGFMELASSGDELTDSQKRLRDTTNEVKTAGYAEAQQIKSLVAIINSQNASTKTKVQAYEDLKKAVPELEGYTLDEAQANNILTKSTDVAAKAIIKRAQAEVFAKAAAEELKAAIEAQSLTVAETLTFWDKLVARTKGFAYGVGAEAGSVIASNAKKQETLNKATDQANTFQGQANALLEEAIALEAELSGVKKPKEEKAQKAATGQDPAAKRAEELAKFQTEQERAATLATLEEFDKRRKALEFDYNDRIAKAQELGASTVDIETYYAAESKKIDDEEKAYKLGKLQEYIANIQAAVDNALKEQLKAQEIAQNQEETLLAQQYSNGQINKEAYEKGRLEITRKYLQAQIDLMKAAGLDVSALEKQLAFTFLPEESVKKTQDNAEKIKQTIQQLNNALNTLAIDVLAQLGTALGSALTGSTDSVKEAFRGMFIAVAGFLKTFGLAIIANGTAIEAFKESLENLEGVGAIVAGVALVATATIVKNVASKGVTAFADGGIVSGPTLGLMGEYPGASSNPEVIAPLDKLQSMLNVNSGGNFVAQTKFDGRDLWLAVNRYEKDKARG